MPNAPSPMKSTENGFVCDLCDLRGKSSVLLFVEYGHGSDGRSGPLSYLQGESNESESLTDHLVEIAQILYVRDPPIRTHAVTGVRFVVPHVGTSGINPEIVTTLINNEFSCFSVQTGIIGHVLRLSVVTVVLSRIKENGVSLANIKPPLFQFAFDLLPPKLGFLRNITDIYTDGRSDALL